MTGAANVVLIVADTTRADALAPPGGQGAAPQLAALAAEGRSWRRAVSPAPWTAPAHASLFTGLSPGEHGLWGPGLLDEQGWPKPGVVTGAVADRWLPARLNRLGHRTLGISANPWVGGYFGFDHGFDQFRQVLAKRPGETRRGTLAAARAAIPAPVRGQLQRRRLRARLARQGQDSGARGSVRGMLEWIGASDRPFFAFLNFMEPHWPYQPAPGFTGLSAAEARRALVLLSRFNTTEQVRAQVEGRTLPAEDLAILRRLYLGEVGYLDGCLDELLGRLSDSGRLSDTVVVITADHGEHIGEHGVLGHWASLYEELVHVPLLALGPADLVGRGVEERRVSTAALYRACTAWASGERAELAGEEPVVAEYEGLWQHVGPVRRMGLRESDPRVVPQTWAVYDGDWKYVRDARGNERLHDLAGDPGEQADARAEGPLEELRSRLAGVLAARQPVLAGGGAAGAERDAGVEAELRALGYL